jgi:hypothetical protein
VKTELSPFEAFRHGFPVGKARHKNLTVNTLGDYRDKAPGSFGGLFPVKGRGKGAGKGYLPGVEGHAELNVAAKSRQGGDFLNRGNAAGYGNPAGQSPAQRLDRRRVEARHRSFAVNAGKEKAAGKRFDGFGAFDQGKPRRGLPAVNGYFITVSRVFRPGRFFRVDGDDKPFAAYRFRHTFKKGGVYPELARLSFFRRIPKSPGTHNDLRRSKAHEFPGLFRRPYSAAHPAFGLTEQGLYDLKIVSRSHGGVEVYHRDFAVPVKFFGQRYGIVPL